MPPIRVAQVVGKMVGGGMEAVVMNYYRHIDRDRVQFDFIVDSDSTYVPAEEIESLGGRIIEVSPYQKQPKNSLELERIFRQENWPIVHSHMNSLSVFPLRAAKHAGVSVRIAHSHSTWGKGELKRNILKAILRTQSNHYPTHRMACTRHAGEWLFGKKARFKVLYNAIELEGFSFDEQARQRLRKELGIPESSFVVGCIGRLTSQKNQSFLIDDVSKMRRNQESFLLIIGDGPDKDELKRHIGRIGIEDSVLMLGQRADVECLYSAMDAFCLPSTYEGLGIVAIEAQANGLPTLVSTNVPTEAILTESIRALPLVDGVWSRELDDLRASNSVSESRKDNLGSLQRYDITLEAPRLVKYYEDAIRNLRGL